MIYSFYHKSLFSPKQKYKKKEEKSIWTQDYQER